MSLQIAIIDDEPEIRSTLLGVLEDAGYGVVTCDSGEKAVELVQKRQFHIAFVDIRLPGIDGLEVLKRFKELHLDIVTIVISAHADIELAVQATRLGAYNFLEKPLQPERILLEVKNVAERLQLQREHDRLRQHVGSAGDMIGESPKMKSLKAAIEKAAPSDARVMIYGENGTGKELVAEAIHRQSHRSNGPFIRVNCAAIPKDLIESELFGHERGAFTGAAKRKIGLIEQAHGGTLFLDEIGDMALDTQAKLLRVLQQNELMRVGGTETIAFDVRVIAATNKDIENEITEGRFREDLYFRLAVIPLEVPALRERMDDLTLLADYFLQQLATAYGRRPKELSPQAAQVLAQHRWPGNVRELRNIIERLMILNDKDRIEEADVAQALPSLSSAGQQPTASPVESHAAGGRELKPDGNETLSLRERVESFEKTLLAEYFESTKGNVSEMARQLRTDRANLHRKLQRYHIK